MKYRNGFVSNSSTSSFVICGFLVPGSENYNQNARKEVLEKLYGITKADVKNEMSKKKFWKDEVDDPEQVNEYFNEMFYEYKREKNGISIVSGEGSPHKGIIVGEILYRSDDDDYGIASREDDLGELIKKVLPIREKMGCTESKIKLYMGTLNC